MSKIGKQPVEIPKGVECKIDKEVLNVKGPKGQLSLRVENHIKPQINANELTMTVDSEMSNLTKFQGLYRALVQNMIVGVTKGFSKQLELKGVGYRAAVQGSNINFQLGFSHPTIIPIPKGIEVKVENNVLITVSGIDKQLVGQFSAELHHLRKPEPYKGKGVHYVGQFLRRKAGKAAAKK